MDEFKLWSELNPQIVDELKPDLGLSSLSSFDASDRENMWKHLVGYFFSVRPDFRGVEVFEMSGHTHDQEHKRELIVSSIDSLNSLYKYNAYAPNFLNSRTVYNAQKDFYEIFLNGEDNLVLELISLYIRSMHLMGSNLLQHFEKSLNDLFLQFGVKYHLSKFGFIPRQEEKIITEIYSPVLKALSEPKWKKVSEILSDAFHEYQANTPTGYSNSVTHSVASIQAFLQILVKGTIGKGEIGELIALGKKEGVIPDDPFTKDISSILMQERQHKGNAHPKQEYATEKNARMVLNLCMIFIQHCIQN